MRLHLSISRRPAVVVAGSSLVLAALLWPSPLLAQTRPTPDAYLGPECFATVVPDLTGRVGSVIGGREPGKQTFSAGESIFMHTTGSVAPGDTLLLFRVDGTIMHPLTNERVGDAVNLLGRVEILDTIDDRAIGQVIASCQEIEVGDGLHALVPTDVSLGGPVAQLDRERLVDPRPSDATVVYGSGDSLRDERNLDRRTTMTNWTSYAAGHVITIDQGRSDGWQLDQRGLLYGTIRGTVAIDPRARTEPIILGQAVVFWLQDETAALLIIEGDSAVELGARVRPLEN